VVNSVLLGHIGVDWARLAFADANALSAWRHHKPIDGLADVAFWGADVDEAAAQLGATRFPEGVFGWENLDLEKAFERYESVENWLEAAPQRRLRIDFRPHSHHYYVMRDVRASENEAGTIEVAGAEILFAMTSWGDGWFPAFADLDPTGNLVALRVDFTPE
jgi:predicted enzyme related to lactoylglutathione lyase